VSPDENGIDESRSASGPLALLAMLGEDAPLLSQVKGQCSGPTRSLGKGGPPRACSARSVTPLGSGANIRTWVVPLWERCVCPTSRAVRRLYAVQGQTLVGRGWP
jgi:hypothetical protein